MADPRPHDGDGPGEMDLLSATVVLYAAMLGATIAGQIAGIAIDSVIGAHSIGVPLGCSVVFEAASGARLGAARSGGPLTARQAGRISATYSAGLLAISVPLLGWMEASKRASGAASMWTPGKVGAALALFFVATLARWGLMTLFGRLARARSAR